jgi:hypothetical protein
MKTNIQYQIDIEDFASEKEVLSAVKRVLSLNRDKEFTSNFRRGNSNYLIEGNGYRLIISNCNCGGEVDLF